jgi:hypothetical protein
MTSERRIRHAEAEAFAAAGAEVEESYLDLATLGLPAGHGPWLVHPSRTAELIQMHLAGTAHHSRAGAPRV